MTLGDFERVANELIRVKEENQELKKKYENAVADYETTMFEKEQLKSQLHEASLTIQEMTERDILCPSNCEKLRQLKKQLKPDYYVKGLEGTLKEYQQEMNKVAIQQKEFINYLEKRYKDVTSVIGSYGSNTDLLYGKKYMLEEILQKYKSIIGE